MAGESAQNDESRGAWIYFETNEPIGRPYAQNTELIRTNNLGHNKHTSPKQAERSKKMRVALDKKRFGPWALVTGASSGIGKEFARQIAASGINIVLVARREDLLKEVGVEFSKRFGVEHRVIVLDVSTEDF